MKPKVWLVDDRQETREKFKEDHQEHFTVRVFGSPCEVLDAIESEKSRPHALLCDIYFYHDQKVAEELENEVMTKAKDLRETAKALDPEGHQTGITLIEAVCTFYCNRLLNKLTFRTRPPFPIYAYTAKGPYLLQGSGFDQLNQLGARWLFKDKYNPESECLIIKRDIKEEYRNRLWSRVLNLVVYILGIVTPWFVGRILDWSF